MVINTQLQSILTDLPPISAPLGLPRINDGHSGCFEGGGVA